MRLVLDVAWIRGVLSFIIEHISHLCLMFLLLTLSMYSFAELIIVFLFCEREYFQNTFKNFICSVFCGCFTNKVELTKFWQFFERNHLQKIAWKYLRSVCCGKRYRQKSFSTRKLIIYVSFRKTCGIKNQRPSLAFSSVSTTLVE